jgi:glycogen operon protein
LTAYNEKHNEANGESGADGESHNRSWNAGVEGETDDPAVLELRNRQRRNFLATLMLSQGIPMLLGGDEMARTQRGNNNAYCQDNGISWFDWEHQDGGLVAFTQRLLAIRKHHPVFRRREYFQGRALHGGCDDIAWFAPDGTEMSETDWQEGYAKSMAVFLNGDAIPSPDSRGDPVLDDTFLVLFNALHDPIEFTLPPERFGKRWIRTLDTADTLSEGDQIDADDKALVEARSLVLLRRVG